jgi:Fic-DOC domain mobile mystery protein B
MILYGTHTYLIFLKYLNHIILQKMSLRPARFNNYYPIELDEFEQLNIQRAMEWTLGRRWKAEAIFSEPFILELHRRMYKDVWAWAGNFRRTEKNLGVPCHRIAMELKMLNDDALFWIADQTYPPDEIAIRVKHRIVAIHCFPNGNGRHSRLLAVVIISHIFKAEVYSWGSGNLVAVDDLRKIYINVLKTADNGDIGPL